MQANDDKAPGLLDRIQAFVEADRRKPGGMSLDAHWRLGISELREVFNPGGNVAQSTPYGMFGTATPGEVGAMREAEPNVLRMDEEPALAHGRDLSPSQIADGVGVSPQQEARGNVHGMIGGQSTGTVFGESHGAGNPPSPGDIAADHSGSAQPDHRLGHGQSRGGRGR